MADQYQDPAETGPCVDHIDTFLKKLQADPSAPVRGVPYCTEFLQHCKNIEEQAANSTIIGSTVAKDKDDEYEMLSSSPGMRGIALIINNKFEGKSYERRGSEKDRDDLKQLWTSLHFEVHVVNDAKAKDMRTELDHLAEKNHQKFHCVVVCIMTHGDKNTVHGDDGEVVPIDDLVRPFYSAESLHGKPKMFFIQACRGDRVARRRVAADSATGRIPVDLPENLLDSPSPIDVLVCFATAPDYAALRDDVDGSWFMQCLVNVFEKHHNTEHVLDLMTRVNRELQGEGDDKFHQVASFRSQLMKKVFLKT